MQGISEAGESGIGDDDTLNALAEAVCANDSAAAAHARRQLLQRLGPEALLDAAATLGAFNAYPRIADATGIPLESTKASATSDLRANLGLDTLMSQ